MIDKLKQWSKKNRKIVVASSLIVLIMFMSGNQKPQATFQPQAVCDSNHFQSSCENAGCFWTENGNTIDKTALSSTDLKLAKAGITAFGLWEGCGAGLATGAGTPLTIITLPLGCAFGYALTGGATSLVGKVVTWFKSDCYSCIPDNYITDKPQACCSGYASSVEVKSITGVGLLSGDNFLCWTPPPEKQCSSGFMGELGKFMLDHGLAQYVDSCSLAAMAGIGIGALFLILMLSFI